MPTIVRMPEVLAGASEAAVQTWLAQPGATLNVGDPLAEIETDKAVVEYAAEVEGTLARHLVEAGRGVQVGEPIAVVLVPGEDDATVGDDADPPRDDAAPSADHVAPAPAASAEPALEQSSAPRLFASPLVRRLANERGIDLTSIRGSGPNGRIVRRDLDTIAVESAPQPAAEPAPAVEPVRSSAAQAPSEPAASAITQPVSAASTPGPADPSRPAADYTDLPVSRMRHTIARRLTESWSTVPQFTLTRHLVVDDLLELRRSLNAATEVSISVNDLLLKAVAKAHREVPEANSVWAGETIRRFSGVDLAVAVAVDDGLVTPVVRGVDTLAVGELAQTVAQLAERARAGGLTPADLEGGTFTISNLGMYGIDQFTAIINPPHSGILAVGSAAPQVIADDGEPRVANVMSVTLSADHRVLDGAVAARWMSALSSYVEQPMRILV